MLALEETGPVDAHALLLLHGFMGSRRDWGPVVAGRFRGRIAASPSTSPRLLHVAVLLAFFGLAAYFPYWWFGVYPWGSTNVVAQAEIERLLAGKNLPDYYAEPLPPISEGELPQQKEAFTWCRFCHTLEEGGEARVGPNLHRIFGKPAAVIAGFAYSDAFIKARDAGLVWTPETMAAFIARPHEIVPGNRMRYPPMIGYDNSEEKQRQILEYLLRETR